MITATDPDHLDIYGTKEAYLESFRKYTSLIQPGGALIVRKGIELQPALQNGVKLYTYSKEEGDFHAENIRIGNGEIFFDYVSPLGNIPNIQLGVPVSINIENGVAAMALAQMSGLTSGSSEQGKADIIAAQAEGTGGRLVIFDGQYRNLRFPVGGDKADFRCIFHDGTGAVCQLVQNGRVGAQELRFYGIFLEHQIVSFQFDVCVRIGLGKVSLDFIYMFYQGFR